MATHARHYKKIPHQVEQNWPVDTEIHRESFLLSGDEPGPSVDTSVRYGILEDVKISLGTQDKKARKNQEMEKMMATLEKMKEIGVTPDVLFKVKTR